MNSLAQANVAFAALADPVRRRLIDHLSAGPASMSELARPLGASLPAITKHLRVLEGGGLVKSTKNGRVRTFRIVPGGLAPVQGWLDRQRRLWEQRLDQLDEHLKSMKEDDA